MGGAAYTISGQVIGGGRKKKWGNSQKGNGKKSGMGLGVPVVLFVSGSETAQIEKLGAFWGSLNCNGAWRSLGFGIRLVGTCMRE